MDTLRNWRRMYWIVPAILLESKNPSAKARIAQMIVNAVVSPLIPEDCANNRAEGINAVTKTLPKESLLYTNM